MTYSQQLLRALKLRKRIKSRVATSEEQAEYDQLVKELTDIETATHEQREVFRQRSS